MSEKRAKDFKAGPCGVAKRVTSNANELVNRRGKKYELGRRRMTDTVPIGQDEHVAALNEFQPAAIEQSQDKAACLLHLQLLDKIIQFQKGVLIVEAVTADKRITPQAAMRFSGALDRLIPRLVTLLEQDADCQVYCAKLLTNMTASTESERWIAIMMQTDIVDAFDRVLANSNHYRPDMASATVTAIISCIGNICIQDAVYRGAFFPRFSAFLLKLAAQYDYLVKDVAFVAHAMMIRYPLLPHPIVAQWQPFITGLIMNGQPIADDEIARYLGHVGVLSLVALVTCESAYRLLLLREPALIARLIEYLGSESIYGPVRVVACDVLGQLTREPQKHAELIQLGVPAALLKALYQASKSIRVLAAVGLAEFARHPSAAAYLSSADARTALLFHIQNGNSEVRLALVNALSRLISQLTEPATIAGWIDAGAVQALTSGFGLGTRPDDAQLLGLQALDHLFKYPGACAAFEECNGDDVLNAIFMHSQLPVLSSAAERLLDTYFKNSDAMEL